MSGKLDQSLDEILSTTRTSRSVKPRRNRVASTNKPTAPIGGVKKQTKATPTGPSALNGLRGSTDSRIQVSGLPKDVSESQIKEYFGKSIGPTKRVEISYGPGGVSRGVATIAFARADAAAKAVQKLNGILVDGRAIKVDVIVDARRAATIPAPKGLSERVQLKPQPKSAAATKANNSAGATRGGKNARGRGGKAGRARPAKKTSDELDSEMADYFEKGTNAGETSAPAQPAGDAVMDDEIL